MTPPPLRTCVIRLCGRVSRLHCWPNNALPSIYMKHIILYLPRSDHHADEAHTFSSAPSQIPHNLALCSLSAGIGTTIAGLRADRDSSLLHDSLPTQLFGARRRFDVIGDAGRLPCLLISGSLDQTKCFRGPLARPTRLCVKLVAQRPSLGLLRIFSRP